jgi:hypothetical protein
MKPLILALCLSLPAITGCQSARAPVEQKSPAESPTRVFDRDLAAGRLRLQGFSNFITGKLEYPGFETEESREILRQHGIGGLVRVDHGIPPSSPAGVKWVSETRAFCLHYNALLREHFETRKAEGEQVTGNAGKTSLSSTEPDLRRP